MYDGGIAGAVLVVGDDPVVAGLESSVAVRCPDGLGAPVGTQVRSEIDGYRPGDGARVFDDLQEACVRLSGGHFLLRIVERMMNMRSRITSIATGDQGIFVSKVLFDDVGGFSDLPLMEDIDFSKRLRTIRKPVALRETLVTSSRRWEQHGIIRTIALMWLLRLAWFSGVSAKRLARYYGS